MISSSIQQNTYKMACTQDQGPGARKAFRSPARGRVVEAKSKGPLHIIVQPKLQLCDEAP